MTFVLANLACSRRTGGMAGITSVCSAHPIVMRAALRHAVACDGPVLIEATCNQVNQFGGYTGLKPRDFVALVEKIAGEERLPRDKVILGGDHLGPNPWRAEPAEVAMTKAEDMIAAYVEAGFRKLHLDTSMGCAGEPVALDDATTAGRAVRLAAVAERCAASLRGEPPVYVIGTEVPPPGGAHHVITTLEPTGVDAARKTIALHRTRFDEAGLGKAFDRVLALVVQPGVEFGNENVIAYDRAKAQTLSALLDEEPALVYEAHSTDYQGAEALRELVEDGFAILKVGPELTFALREALYGLDLIASDSIPGYPSRNLMAVMDALMRKNPGHWKGHYQGSQAKQHILRHYSYSDRIRYYWNHPAAEDAVSRLTQALDGRIIPAPLFRQHLPTLVRYAGKPLEPQELLIDAVRAVLDEYQSAHQPGR
ncbi:D-tagatose-bisphosphate aldolase, class II, non-catalytic subunit (plasmid) [Rhizobium sp. CC1099]|uniref:D-tagatose-bisphosphate aldolase, class II, non-catalytic subunit n=1 Tax=Rhizobium sp. CC1099 TaxID=3039160 RepID=UPI0024B1CCC9|nr:D-tagatose-bisphosphate aldolase, class II, non-catalytic subunit [Rhizobium sp. CC1099]WFU90375.1 D-tagatose-bisphosphate aldolase, class II, non-catalytic subunit [Rhizobium sp. CC1099]